MILNKWKIYVYIFKGASFIIFDFIISVKKKNNINSASTFFGTLNNNRLFNNIT